VLFIKLSYYYIFECINAYRFLSVYLNNGFYFTYEGLKIEFKEGVEIITKEVENVINKIESNELLNSEQKTSINLKFKHFQKQVLYDYFNIPMTF